MFITPVCLLFLLKLKWSKNKGVYKSVDCEKITEVADTRKYLSDNKLCFNCTRTKHRVADYRCKFSCQKWNGKHHSSICDKNPDQLMVATGEGPVVVRVVVVEVEGITCRALLGTGAGSSYASAIYTGWTGNLTGPVQLITSLSRGFISQKLRFVNNRPFARPGHMVQN